MKQQPDKLFFDKLNTFGKEAPPMTWERIEDGLDQKKRRKIFWFSAAAAVSIIAVAAITVIDSDSSSVTIAENKTLTEPGRTNEIVQKDPATENSAEPSNEDSTRADVTITERQVERKSEIKKEAVGEAKSSVAQISTIKEVESMEQKPILEDTSKTFLSEPTQLAFKAPEKKDNVTIVLTADQTKNYLTTKNTTVQATSEEKKSSTLKKLLKKAADLKVNQDPFGELRQRKNEILALNFRSDKQRGQKK